MTPEIKNHVFAKVTEMIESCCENEKCVCDPDADGEAGPFDDDGDQDFLFEQARDRRYFE